MSRGAAAPRTEDRRWVDEDGTRAAAEMSLEDGEDLAGIEQGAKGEESLRARSDEQERDGRLPPSMMVPPDGRVLMV